MSVSLSAALAIHAAAAQALASTPSSMLAPYAPKGPINARALGAIAWMKNSSRMADLLALVQTCNTLEQLLSDPKSFAALVDRPQERKCPLLVDYVLFPSEEGILVGYGMEYEGRWGNLPGLHVLDR